MDFKERLTEFEHLTRKGEGGVNITSSGSTGEPKKLHLPIIKLKQYIGEGPSFKGLSWATCFDPISFAGTVVAFQAWANNGSVIQLRGGDFSSCWELLAKNRITALSLTPSFLRLLFLHRPIEAGRSCNEIHRLTLGGEVVGAELVQLAKKFWPDCAIRVIYASAELGVIFRSRDYSGQYFPKDLVSQWQNFKVEGNQLSVEARSSPGEWVETGDLAELDSASGGVRLLGRQSRVVNIGGQKFSLDAIERVIESVGGVSIVRCEAVRNPVVGNVVSCAWDGPASEEAILRVCQSELPKPAWPRIWEPGSVVLSRNGKR